MNDDTRRVTIAVIADAAGVSAPTVSKVLNGRADVAAETRSRIESVLSQFGYQRPEPRRPRRSGLIDLVFHDLSPWALEVIRGAEHAALEVKSRIAVTVASDEAETRQWLATLAAGRTDGVILVLTELSATHRKRLAALRVPIVLIDPVGQPEPGIPSIGAANWSGGLAATEHLIGLGHRRIGTITGRPDVLCTQQRLDGYRAALKRAGLPADPRLIAYGDFRYDNARLSAAKLLALPDPPTAIFAASDVQAMGVYEAARERHLRIPDHLSVVGFDDVPMAQWMAPPLTTLRQPLREMAALAVRTLLSGDAASYNQRVELATNLVLRSHVQQQLAERPVRRVPGHRLRRHRQQQPAATARCLGGQPHAGGLPGRIRRLEPALTPRPSATLPPEWMPPEWMPLANGPVLTSADVCGSRERGKPGVRRAREARRE